MLRTYNMQEARSQLSQLAERAANGEEIVIARNGRPLAKLVSLQAPLEPRRLSPQLDVPTSHDLDYPLPSEIEQFLEGESD
jgi:prevent-host-death family protein